MGLLWLIAALLVASVVTERAKLALARRRPVRPEPTRPLPAAAPQAPYVPVSRTFSNGPTWGQVAGTVGGLWALHQAWEHHQHSEHLRNGIADAQYYAQGHETFGSPEYYRAEREYLHHHG